MSTLGAPDGVYDVIVVGSGPSGSTTALRLARCGWRVLLLERDRLPRAKTCAGGLPRKTLEAVGIDVSDVAEASIRRGIVTYRTTHPLEMRFERPLGQTVMRANFDAKLARAAVEAGVELREGCRVRGVTQTGDEVIAQTEAGEFRARTLVGADSVNSVVARAVGLMPKRRAAVAIEAEMPVPPDALERYRDALVFDFGLIPHGYAWIFAKSDHLSVGAAVFHDQGDKHIRQRLIDYATRVGLLAPGQPLDCPCKGHLIPLGDGPRPLHQGRVLLVGDAAGLADPFLGEGIYYAVRSGLLAAEALDEALRGRSVDLSSYTEGVNAEIITEFGYALRFAKWCYRMPRVAHWLLRTRPALRAALADALEGHGTWQGLWHDGVRSLLPLPRHANLPVSPLHRVD